MIRASQIALLALLISATGMVLWLGSAAHRVLVHLDQATYNASAAAYNANGTVATVNDTLAALNAPCKDFQGDWICGPIPQLSQTEKNVGIIAAKSAQQVNNLQPLIQSAAQSLQSNSDHLNKTIDATTDLTKALTTDVKTANDTIEDAQPLLEAYTRSGDSLNALLKSTNLSEGMHHLNETTGNVAGITGSLDKMTAHLEKNFDSPKPIWKTAIPMSEDIGKIVLCFTKHICVE